MNITDSIRTNTPGCREGETMNITRRGKESCSTCHHATICRMKEQRAKVEKELADMASLMENKNFDIRSECDYYERENDARIK